MCGPQIYIDLLPLDDKKKWDCWDNGKQGKLFDRYRFTLSPHPHTHTHAQSPEGGGEKERVREREVKSEQLKKHMVFRRWRHLEDLSNLDGAVFFFGGRTHLGQLILGRLALLRIRINSCAQQFREFLCLHFRNFCLLPRFAGLSAALVVVVLWRSPCAHCAPAALPGIRARSMLAAQVAPMWGPNCKSLFRRKKRGKGSTHAHTHRRNSRDERSVEEEETIAVLESAAV